MTYQDKDTATEGGSESSARNLLKFTCPHCGGHSLRQYDSNPYYWSCEVSVWLEDKDDTDTVQIDEESEPVYERTDDPYADPGWCCAGCGRVLCYADGTPLGTAGCLAEWLLEHSCDQEDISAEERVEDKDEDESEE